MRRVAIVTGAGTGVGKVTAVKLSDVGYTVILIGRREDKLEETKKACNAQTIVLPMDVSIETDVKNALKWCRTRFLV